jgi:hypothetical protein
MIGLEALVLNDKTGALTVLMVDSADHFPRLIARGSAIVRSESAPATAATNDPLDNPNDPTFYWDIKGCEVTVASGTGKKVFPGKGLLDRRRATLAAAGTRGDVSWIPHLARVTKSGHARLNEGCFAADPRPAKISARVRFVSGEISALFRKASDVLDYSQIEYQFRTSKAETGYRQALGAARLLQQVPPGTVTFNVQPFDKDKPAQKIVLRSPAYTSLNSAGPLEIGVTNEPKPTGCKTLSDIEQLDHFKMYYALLDSRDQQGIDLADPPIPHLSGANRPPCAAAGPGQLRDEVVWCPPFMGDSDSRA